ncbi:MAG TPA: hypothetical protein VNO50_17740 [Pyrinomonadaceae bacterium]|nr:hypothetical protein [Pyrinomonadaceae bacterium]
MENKKAPKARNEKAWANGPRLGKMVKSGALKAQSDLRQNALSPLQGLVFF